MKRWCLIVLLFSACSTQTRKENIVAKDSTSVQDSVARVQNKEIDDELRIYSGQFEWHSEGGAEGSGVLVLTYNENREFAFSLSTSLYECGASLQGTLFADRSQHAFYKTDSCFLHFNFLQGETVEIVEDNCNKHPAQCKFEGDYVRVKT